MMIFQRLSLITSYRHENLPWYGEAPYIYSDSIQIKHSLPSNPISKNEKEHFIKSKYASYKTHLAKLYNLSNVFISEDGVISRKKKVFLESLIFEVFLEKFNKKYIRNEFNTKRIHQYSNEKKTIHIFDHWSKSNYYHWMCDAIPRLYEFKKSNSTVFNVLLPPNAADFQIQSLKTMGFIPLVMKAETLAYFKSIYFLSSLSSSGFIHPIISDFRQVFDKYEIQLPNTKVFIKRKEGNPRSLENFQEIENILLANNFQIIEAENLTFEEQKNLFKKTTILVSTHGAGLTNMIFMPAGSKIIEITDLYNEDLPLCFYSLAKTLNHQYEVINSKLTENNQFLLEKVQISNLINTILDI